LSALAERYSSAKTVPDRSGRASLDIFTGPVQDAHQLWQAVAASRLDGADMFQQGGIDSIVERVALAENPGDLPRLPINDARQDQVQAAAGVHLLPQLASVNPAAPPVEDVPG